MTCPHGNQVRDEHGTLVPSGTEIFDAAGNIVVCGECKTDHQELDQEHAQTV